METTPNMVSGAWCLLVPFLGVLTMALLVYTGNHPPSSERHPHLHQEMPAPPPEKKPTQGQSGKKKGKKHHK